MGQAADGAVEAGRRRPRPRPLVQCKASASARVRCGEVLQYLVMQPLAVDAVRNLEGTTARVAAARWLSMIECIYFAVSAWPRT